MSQLTVNSMFFRDAGIGDYRVEQQIDYRLEDSMTPAMAGFTDRVTTKVMVRSQADEEVLNRFVVRALRCCFYRRGLSQ